MFENFSRVGYITLIILILGVAFLSQQSYARDTVSKMYPKISGAVANGGADIIKSATNILKK